MKIINFCPILPDIVSMDKELRERAFEAYELGVETAKYFQAETVQTDSFTPPLKFNERLERSLPSSIGGR